MKVVVSINAQYEQNKNIYKKNKYSLFRIIDVYNFSHNYNL